MGWWLDDEMPVKAVGVGGRGYEAEGNIFEQLLRRLRIRQRRSAAFLGCRSMPGWSQRERTTTSSATRGICTIGPPARWPFINVPPSGVEWPTAGRRTNVSDRTRRVLRAPSRAGKPINDGPRMARTDAHGQSWPHGCLYGPRDYLGHGAEFEGETRAGPADWNTKVEMPPLATPGGRSSCDQPSGASSDRSRESVSDFQARPTYLLPPVSSHRTPAPPAQPWRQGTVRAKQTSGGAAVRSSPLRDVFPAEKVDQAAVVRTRITSGVAR